MKPDNHYHRQLVGWLSEMGLSYTEEYPVGQYSIDIFLPELSLFVEVDGPHHFGKADRKREAAILALEPECRFVRIKTGTLKTRALEKILGPYK